jgi:hypothetical protein
MAQSSQSQRGRPGTSRSASGTSRNGARSGTTRNGRRVGGAAGPVEFVKEQAQRAGEALGPIAENAGKPALAAGAALAGLAAGLALAPRGSRRLNPVRSVTGAGGTANALLRTTREVHAAACTMHDVASELRQLRELAQVGRNRSPIEVVLQGLTRRPEQ